MRSVKHARSFAQHLFKEENDVITVLESSLGGQSREDVEADLIDMQLQTNLTKGFTGIFHVAINPRMNETMTAQQWQQAIDLIETEFNLSNQNRLQVYHEKVGRPHLHVFWSLTNLEEKRLIYLPYYKRRLQKTANRLEITFGHQQTPRRAGPNSIEITNADRMRQARTGKDVQKRKRYLSSLWKQSTTSEEFLSKLKKSGYTLAQGNKCRYLLFDSDGEHYNLVRQLPKLVKQKDVHARLGQHYQTLPQSKVYIDKSKAHKRKKRLLEKQKRRIKQKRKGKYLSR